MVKRGDVVKNEGDGVRNGVDGDAGRCGRMREMGWEMG